MPTFRTSAGYPNGDDNETNQENCDGANMPQKMAEVKALYVKMRHELAMAKREIAWGKLGAKDINDIVDLCRSILMPL